MPRKAWLVAATVAIGISGCTSVTRHTTVDYVDALHFDGRTYQSLDTAPVSPAELGASVGHVSHTLAGTTNDPSYRLKDGDATFVPTGSPIYAVKGAQPGQELAAEHDGVMHLYKALPQG